MVPGVLIALTVLALNAASDLARGGGVARRMLRVGHYLNQFFAGVGAEEHANHPPEQRDGAVGSGRALQALLKDEGRVVSTLVCGDNFFNERPEAAHAAVREWLRAIR